MIGLLRDLPDWSTGAMMGGVAWFGIAYGVLAPRAMQFDQERDIVPSCMETLRETEGVAIDRAVKRRIEDAEFESRELRRKLNNRLDELREARIELLSYDMLKSSLCGSGICDLLPMKMPEVGFGIDDVDQEIGEIKDRLSTLRAPDISIPRVPETEVLQTCACAAGTVLAGKKTSYALSLASFRVFSPEDVGTMKSELARTLRMDACGIPAWEDL
ncbi:MAG: hypothetical protein AAFX08_08355 [Pseudomonadota bacterium]